MMAGEPGRKPDDRRTAFRLNPDGTWTEPGWCPSRERYFFITAAFLPGDQLRSDFPRFPVCRHIIFISGIRHERGTFHRFLYHIAHT